ncbi:uncharacterized protein LOC126298421 isoform X2 [Schistocerca gregaria]|uniref:uncharacterized protein LOC126298421 isoform X2 n=1 Tax=Schistocerca gregaria TaxID=7010 RepID=UPI00211F0FA1|nr:uncharacterized protein LOC126298421 isoform X2 [Schistocerca gregaria]
MGKVDVVKLYDNKKRVKSWDRCSTDRFIGVRCRRRPGVSIHHYERISDHLRKDILFQDLKEEQKDKYKRRLRTILNIPEPYESILRITSGQQRYELKETHWPVRARKHPFLSVPELVLDMPLFSADMSLNTLDWGKNGLASSLGDAIFIWNGSKEIQKITAFDETNREMFATALKWNKSGNHLAIGIERSCIQVWNATSLKKVQEMWCTCAASSGCVIAALEWHPRENILVSGCSKGIIEVCTVPGVLITVSFLNHMLPSINTMNFSCDGNRIAISSFNGRLKIARWPHDNDVLEIPNISTCRSYAWHPWDSSLIVTAGITGEGDLYLWNIEKVSIVAKYTAGDGCLSKVIALTWSPVTAELVVSMQVNRNSNDVVWKTEILVLASLTKVVDKLDMEGTHCHSPYLLWSPDGHDIATASSDETLRIWNFLGVEKRRCPFPAHKKLFKKPRLNIRSCCLTPFNYISCIIR